MQEAAFAFQAAIEIAPENASYHFLLGDAFVRLGAERQALSHYRSAGRLGPFDTAYVEKIRRWAARAES